MLQKRKQQSEERGFTIIEVLIVLAIAGLILLIVFLAVPALQRNSRNTQRRSDVSALLSGVSEFSNDNQGTTPAAATYATKVVTYTNTGAGASSVSTAKLGYYTAAPTVIVTSVAGGAGAIPGTAPASNAVDIIVGAVCNGNTPTTTNATSRSVVAFFSVEQSGGDVGQCTESGA